MLIACDLDRTLLPNGSAPDDGSLTLFFEQLRNTEHVLVYVTGRNLNLVHEARDTYGLELPDYLVSDVGTTMYKQIDDTLIPHESWGTYLTEQTGSWDWGSIVEKIQQSPNLYLQESWRQNPYKCSYYILDTDKKRTKETLKVISSVLNDLSIDAQVIFSTDPLKNIGLVDILPKAATKMTALQYLTNELQFPWETDVIYCGDSGNDILPLTSGCKAVIVKNAEQELKDEVLEIAEKKHITAKIYLAKGSETGNGNYASGVIEGLQHFNVINYE